MMKEENESNEKGRRTTAETLALQGRIVEVKKKLPAGSVSMFISRFPEFDTYKKSSRVNNVWRMVIVDEEITEKLETLAKEFASSGGNLNQKVY